MNKKCQCSDLRNRGIIKSLTLSKTIHLFSSLPFSPFVFFKAINSLLYKCPWWVREDSVMDKICKWRYLHTSYRILIVYYYLNRALSHPHGLNQLIFSRVDIKYILQPKIVVRKLIMASWLPLCRQENAEFSRDKYQF